MQLQNLRRNRGLKPGLNGKSSYHGNPYKGKPGTKAVKLFGGAHM